MLAEPLEGAQPRLLTEQMVPGPDVPHSFIYLYEQPWGGCWVPDVSSFVQGSFVSLSDVQSKITSCYCPELVTRLDAPTLSKPPGTFSTPVSPLLCPPQRALFPFQQLLSYQWDSVTSAYWSSPLELSRFCCQGLCGRRRKCREQRSESKNAPELRICTVVCPDHCFLIAQR